ncbi:hypothetical protein Mgra_00003428 [Meloidogyne graminicola]|uniref:SPRY domain-containing protein n=1 Tax=Meloidogyne graminicola TaxID=189291 RepID=A0A8S9ZTZ1_9BILA|nr:hypothetical protein Mgra_00003428 [Meloidogyne graminicola]
MTSFTSNSNLNREDSFSDLGDIIMVEKVETFSTTSQMTDQEFKKRLDELTKRNEELAAKLKKFMEVKVCFLKVSNKWKLWYHSTCCRSNCVKNDTPNTTCNNGWGFIQITSNTNVKYNCNDSYINCNSNILINLDNNKVARIEAKNCFKRPESSQLCLNCSVYTLCYYEIKLKIERSKPILEIGFSYHPLQNIHLCVFGCYIAYFDNILKKTKFINLSSFSFNNEDIIGCGVVYPPPNINNNKLPYIFFTKNGELIDLLFKNLKIIKKIFN